MKAAEVIVLAALALCFCTAVVWTLVKSKETRVWAGGAYAAFVNGFIEGCPIGSPAGAGIAAADGQIHADFGHRHLLIEAAHVLAVPFFTGLSDVRTFTKANPFPNFFAVPALIPAIQAPPAP